MDAIYTAEALSTGTGRLGHVRTPGGEVDLAMTPPRQLGGAGVGSNPEQLFAAGFAACFHSAVLGAARAEKIPVQDSSVGAQVSIGSIGNGAFGLAVHLEVVLPGIDSSVAQGLADIAHANCPYSNATRGNIEVRVTVSDD